MKRFSISRTGKYLILICIILFLGTVFLGFMLTRQSAKSMRVLIEDRMLDVSNTAAAMLDGDALEKVQAEDYDTKEYQDILRILTYYQDNIELEYIYCIKDMGNKHFVFTIDPTVKDPGIFGQPVVYTDALYKASMGIPAVDEKPYEDEWGRFYSAYSPVLDSNNKVAGIVAVDFSADWFESQISHLIWITIAIIAVTFFISVIIIFIIVGRMRKGFTILFDEMNELSNGIEVLVREVSSYENYDDEIEDNDEPVSEEIVLEKDEILSLSSNIRTMQDKLSKQVALIRSRAYVDGLTKLKNRSAYEECIASIEDKIDNSCANFSVSLFDINHLKIINDDFGHEEGDRVICIVANALSKIYNSENIYRIGGDEFVVIQENDMVNRMRDLKALLLKISDEEEELKAYNLDIAVSVGYAVYDSKIDDSFQSTFNRADEEMYNDKRTYYASC